MLTAVIRPKDPKLLTRKAPAPKQTQNQDAQGPKPGKTKVKVNVFNTINNLIKGSTDIRDKVGFRKLRVSVLGFMV